jgi:hypothetical protein
MCHVAVDLADDRVWMDSYAGSLTRWGGVLIRWHCSSLKQQMRLPRALQTLYGNLPAALSRSVLRHLRKRGIRGIGLASGRSASST